MADALYHQTRYIRGGIPAGSLKVSGTVAAEIKAGDLLVLTSSKAIRVSSLADSGTLAQNQEAAHDVFLGSALSGKLAGETRDILVQPNGVHRYPCVALGAALDVGTLIGIAGSGTGLAVGMEDQKVVSVATANLAIGKLVEPAAIGATELIFEMSSALGTPQGGTQAPA